MALHWFFRPIPFLFTMFVLQFSLTSSVSESEALIRLKNSFANTSALHSWASGSLPCERRMQWDGVLCFNGIITGLQLEYMGLSGKIDIDALAQIQGLRTLSFASNAFQGPIPELSRLGYLRAIYLRGNQFSGEIPSDFFSKMKSLKKLWLSGNNFTGGIPTSLLQLSRLTELHLENNQFSGTIPPFDQVTLTSFNVSNNKLQGEIPPSLVVRFNATSFEGNNDLCGDKFGKKCESTVTASLPTLTAIGTDSKTATKDGEGSDLRMTIAGIITLSVLFLSVAAVVVFRIKRRQADGGDKLGNRGTNAAAEVQVRLSNSPKAKEQTKKLGSGVRRSTHGKSGAGDLVIVNDDKGVFGMPDLMKASAEVLGNGGLGSSYKAVMANGVVVVVKRMREMNALAKDGFNAEIAKLGSLRHANILTPLAFHYRPDEKLLIYKYMPKGSLLYLLHGDRGPSHAELNWSVRLKIVQGIAKGLGYLHTELASSYLPHGNLKSSNVLLSPDNEPLLSEFGFGPLIDPPMLSQTQFGYKAPEVTQYGVSPKCDVYCLGIIILEVLTGKFPSQYLSSNASGGIDVVQWMEFAIAEGKECEMLDPEMATTWTNSIGQMKQLLRIGAACVVGNPAQRLDIQQAIEKIEEIQLEDGDDHETRRIQVLPSLRDGYADAACTDMSSIQEIDISGQSRRIPVSGSTRRGTGSDHFSFRSPY